MKVPNRSFKECSARAMKKPEVKIFIFTPVNFILFSLHFAAHGRRTFVKHPPL